MLKKTITYDDYNGEKQTEDFYFNLTKAELVELELSAGKKGFAEQLQEIVKTEDGKMIIDQFKKIIMQAYGQKSEDGRRFIKSKELCDEFAQHAAFSELFVELATDADAASAFINGIVPAAMASEIAEAAKNVDAEKKVETVELPTTEPKLVEEKKFEQYSRPELLQMSQDEFDKLVGTDPNKMTQQQLQIAFQRKNKQ